MLAAVLRTLRDPTALDSLAAILERRRFGVVIARKRTSAARLEAAPRTNRRDVKGRDMTQKKLTDEWPVLGSVISRPFTSLRFVLGAASSLAALVLFLAILTPNLLRSRMAANESSTVGSLRVLNTAANIYSGVYGHYPPSLKSFGPPSSGAPTENATGIVDPTLAGGRKSGYQFTYQTTPAGGRDSRGGYAIQATPIEPGKGGYRHFSTNETGAIFADGAELGGPSLPDKAQGLGHQVLEEQEIARQVAETSRSEERRVGKECSSR